MVAHLGLTLDSSVAVSPATPAERETIIRRAEDEDAWVLWTDDPTAITAMRRLAGRPGVTVREEDGAVRAAFPAKALKIRGLPMPPRPCGVRPPANGLKIYERETIFRRGFRGKAWEVCTTSPRTQEALLKLVDGERVRVARSERRREELVFTLPAAAVRIVPPRQYSEEARVKRAALAREALARVRTARSDACGHRRLQASASAGG